MGLFYRYLFLDAARLKHQIHSAIELNSGHQSLYKNRPEEPLSDLGPYLFSIPKEENFINWYAANGWGDAWGVLIETEASFEDVFSHFSSFLVAKTEEGEELYFRFYDPRVLKTFLPSCDKSQLQQFFGPVEKFITEGFAKEEAIEFFCRNGELVQRVIKAEDIFGRSVVTPAADTTLPKRRRRIIMDDEFEKGAD